MGTRRFSFPTARQGAHTKPLAQARVRFPAGGRGAKRQPNSLRVVSWLGWQKDPYSLVQNYNAGRLVSNVTTGSSLGEGSASHRGSAWEAMYPQVPSKERFTRAGHCAKGSMCRGHPNGLVTDLLLLLGLGRIPFPRPPEARFGHETFFGQ